MPFYHFSWTPQMEEYIAQHGVTREEFEEAVSNPDQELASDSSGRPACRGTTSTGKRLFCVYEVSEDGFEVEPVTAYEIGY
ncbi:MAG: hypothetical protein AB7I48_09365 [Planctomycetaceae bacterium]